MNLAEVTHQRDELKAAIREAAIKAGIIRPDAEPDGPMLLMLCQDLASVAQRTARDPFHAKGPTVLVLTLTDVEGDSRSWIPAVSRSEGESLDLIDNLSGNCPTASVQLSVRPAAASAASAGPLLTVKLDAEEWDRVEEQGCEIEERLQRMGDHFHAHQSLLVVTESNLKTGEILSLTLVEDQAAADLYMADTTEPGRVRACRPMTFADTSDRDLIGDKIIVSGEPGGALAYTGPFEDMEAALRAAEGVKDFWCIHDLSNPFADAIWGQVDIPPDRFALTKRSSAEGAP